jgi:DNA ligase 1
MPKQQASLDSFFAVPKGKQIKKQQTVTRYFGQGKENDGKKDDSAMEEVTTAKEQPEHVGDDEAIEPSSSSVKRESPTTALSAASKRSKRRRAILDDDSDEGSDCEKDSDKNPPAVNTEEGTDEPMRENPLEKSSISPISSCAKSGNKNVAAEEASKDEEQSHTKSPQTGPISAVKEEELEDAMTPELGLPIDDTPERRKLTRRGEKIAKAYKVEPTVDSITSPILYSDLVKQLEAIEAITSRLDIQAILTKFLRRVLRYSPQDVYAVVYLASNSVAPAYECVELGIGDSLLIKAISEAYGSKPNAVKETYQEEGDLGTVAQSCKSKQRTLGFGSRPKPLTVKGILQVYREIANISGSSSQKLKVDRIKKLLVAVQDSAETKYIIRGLQGKLRIGLAQSTVLVALAHALIMTIPSTVVVGAGVSDGSSCADETDGNSDGEDVQYDPIAKALTDDNLPVEKTLEAASSMVRKVYSEVPSYDALLDAALRVPLVDLHKVCHFQPGIPVEPMLAKPTKSLQEVLKRLDGQEFTCEFKYDGERAQIHKTNDGTLKVFSRNLLETSNKYPEVPLFVQEAARAAVTSRNAKGESGEDHESADDNDEEQPVHSFVLDAEVVAFNQKTGQLVPFQVLSTRKKSEESADTAKVQVIVQAFDLMYLNGKSLLSTRLKERRALLHKHFAPVEGKFQFATSLDCVEDGDTTTLEQFLDTAVKGQCEGLMVKTMDDVYEPSRRSLNWLKLKKDYLDGLGDSFDLVPLGAYYGRGKRTGVYGAYLLACYDEESEEFQSVCKIGTGFSDEDLQSLSATLNEHKLEGGKSSQYVVADGLECDVWFDAVQVWEVKAADLSKSSLHRGAIGKLEEGRGIGLRFPRFERIRVDKSPEQATNSDQILDMYYNQDTVKGQSIGNDDDDDGL